MLITEHYYKKVKLQTLNTDYLKLTTKNTTVYKTHLIELSFDMLLEKVKIAGQLHILYKTPEAILVLFHCQKIQWAKKRKTEKSTQKK